MKVGDLVTHREYKGSIGFVSQKKWWNQHVYEVMWFKHYYDTGFKSPVYDWEVEVIV